MTDINHSELIRNLSSDYYNNKLSKTDYRQQRKIILDKIDAEYNGRKSAAVSDDPNVSHDQDQSMFMRTIAFFKNKDL
jgi:hypothetical protein